MSHVQIDARNVWLVLAAGIYWAWGFSALHEGFGWAAAPAGAWAVNVAAHAATLIVVAAASLKLPSPSRPATAVLASGLVASVGTALAQIAGTMGSTPLAYVSLVAMGVGTAPLAAVLFPQFARLAGSGTLFVSIGSSAAMGPLVALVAVSLPWPLSGTVLALLPLASAFSITHGYLDDPGIFQPEGESQGSSVNAPLLVTSFVFALCATLFRVAGVSDGSTAGVVGVMSTSFLALVAIVAAAARAGFEKRPKMLVFVFVPVLAAGVLLLPFLLPEERLVTGALVNIARNLFSIYLYSALAAIVAAGGRGVFVTGLVVGAGDLGHIAGSLLEGILAAPGSQVVTALCVAVAYAVFFSAMLLFLPTKPAQGQAFGRPVEEPEGQAESPVVRASIDAGLSEREAEVLPLLVGPRTMAAIADELGVSYNTAKTHTSHIFRKAGVGSRAELTAWVESFGR